MKRYALCALLFVGCGGDSIQNFPSANQALPGPITTWKLNYPNSPRSDPDELGSTHEITWDQARGGDKLWITGELHDQVVSVDLNGNATFHPMPVESGPHGIEFNKFGELFVSFEYSNQLARLSDQGTILQTFDVHSDPHGLGIDPDGVTCWYTGKEDNQIGKLETNGTVTNYPLATPNALPIYIKAGPDGNMWFTELTGNKIGRITRDGQIREFSIPTPNSRPIAVRPDPSEPYMWFTEEAGNKVGRIDMQGNIVEFPIPKTQENVILASLAFDSGGDLWVQQYVDQNHPNPPGEDHIIRISRQKMSFTYYTVPDRETVMHRITQGPDGNMWFTELKNDRVGRVLR